MSNWAPLPPHPDDEWVEITTLGDRTPRFLLARSGAELEIQRAADRYIIGQTTFEDFEAALNRVYDR